MSVDIMVYWQGYADGKRGYWLPPDDPDERRDYTLGYQDGGEQRDESFFPRH